MTSDLKIPHPFYRRALRRKARVPALATLLLRFKTNVIEA